MSPPQARPGGRRAAGIRVRTYCDDHATGTDDDVNIESPSQSDCHRDGSLIWNPLHLDKNRRFRTYWYVPVCTVMWEYIISLSGMYQYMPVCTKQQLSEHRIYWYYHIKELVVFHSGCIDFRSIHGGIHFPRAAQHILVLGFKCKIIHFLASSVRRMYIQVYTGIYIYTKVTTTFHAVSA